MDLESRVEMKVAGMNVVIKNRHFQIRFDEKGKATSLIFHGQEFLNNLKGEVRDPDREHSFYCDYHVNGKTENMKPSQLKILANDNHMVHIAYCDVTSILQIEYHTIIFADQAQIYQYVKAANYSNAVYSVNELRTIYRLDHDLFNIAVNHEREGYQPTSLEMEKGEKLQDETFRMKQATLYGNSYIYQKYDYSGYFEENKYWGMHGNRFGFWFIPVNTSYYPGGPLKQDLIVHYDSIILNYLTSSHYGADNFDMQPGWSKLYGPWCVYMNDRQENPDLLTDAENAVDFEANQWPYLWMDDTQYPLELSNVSSRLTINKSIPANEMTVVLAQPDHDHEFYRQKENYIYSTTTDQQGEFHFEKVRPGEYTIYAYANGGHLTGELYHDHFIVGQDPIQNIDAVDFSIKESQLIWQIGESTHTTEGFKFSNQPRNYIWHELVPKNLIYHVGSNDDWYYLQDYQGEWKILFDLSNVKDNKNYRLTVALAGGTTAKMTYGMQADISVSLNGKLLGSKPLVNDSSAYRSAVRSGRYRELIFDVSGHNMLTGTNTIGIKTSGFIMYDTIKLEEK